VLAGFVQGMVIPPGLFRFALYNNSGFGAVVDRRQQIAKYRTCNVKRPVAERRSPDRDSVMTSLFTPARSHLPRLSQK
jgi:hypothetical protein